MKIVVEINSCGGCRHRDHSGAFTPGGAQQVCGHPNASDWVSVHKNIHKLTSADLKKINSQDKTTRKEGDKIFKSSGAYWKNRVLPNWDEIIPDWCPLKQGCGY